MPCGPDGVARMGQRGERAVRLCGIWRGEFARPLVIAIRGDIPVGGVRGGGEGGSDRKKQV